MEKKQFKFGAVIQARMNSRRFPGKVLAELSGSPLIAWVTGAALQALPKELVVVATSEETTDSPLANWCQKEGIHCIRGALDNVFSRVQQAASILNCDAVFRICADSPFYRPDLMHLAMQIYRPEIDLVTNAFPRSFPKGCTIELLKNSTLQNIDPYLLSSEQAEHMSKYFYDHPEKFQILNFSNEKNCASLNACVDTPSDLSLIGAFITENPNVDPRRVPLTTLIEFLARTHEKA